MRRTFVCLLVPALMIAMSVGARAAEPEMHRVERGQPLDPCPELPTGFVARESQGEGSTVDSCGRKVDSSGTLLSFRTPVRATLARVTIDRMSVNRSDGHGAGGPLALMGAASVYSLSDGSQWSSGAGSYYNYTAQLDHVEVSGTKVRYVLVPPASIYQQTDYDSGDHSAQGRLDSSGPLVLEAELGSTKAVLRANALLASNDATWYGEPLFNYYSAVVGSVVPVELIYTMQGGSTWTTDAFSRSFSFTVIGIVDFAHPVSVPRITTFSIAGPSRVPDEKAVRFAAVATYENGVQSDVSAAAAWTVDPSTFASVAGGILTIGALPVPEAFLTLRATLVQGEDTFVAEKQVHVLAEPTAEEPGTWPMYQANARHTGYLATNLDPAALRLKWRRNVGGSFSLNPVAAGDGKVFVTLRTYFNDVPTLFALGASDGATLWSEGFGDIFSVNPPSYAYGNVYIQTGNHGSDTWLRAFDGETGAVVFKAPHSAQWERYLAPTIYDGKAYINGGYYGGMYGFDAFTGDQLWFANLPQYDGWTPAVDAGHAYAYLTGLHALNRQTGSTDYFIQDPNWYYDSYKAPVLGDHDDVIVTEHDKLISFDTASHTIRWAVAGQFTGQPSVAQGHIYAIGGGQLRVLDEVTHAELWSWQAAEGDLSGPMIVTDSHVFVSSNSRVHAVSLTSHQSVWSYAAAGHLAIADGMLYVASEDGWLTALSGPPATSFYTVTPCRVMDTRGAAGVPLGGPALTSGLARNVHVPGLCGVPATAKALAVNVTVVGAQSGGYLSLGTSDSGPTSTLNYPTGVTRSNNAFVTLSLSGDFDALAMQSSGTTVHVIIDVSGYFE